MVKMNDVILTDSIDGIGTEQFKDYLAMPSALEEQPHSASTANNSNSGRVT